MKLAKLRKELDGLGWREVALRERASSIVLEGRVPTWDDRVALGKLAARRGWKGVVNDLEVPGLAPDRPSLPARRDGLLEGRAFDVAIVGGGVVGAAVARELARLDVSVVVLEKEHDVAVHASSRNDGMIHDGFAAKPGTLKARLNVEGNRLWGEWARELSIDFSRPGSLILFTNKAAAALYPLLVARANENRVDGHEYWSRAKVRAEEPYAADEQRGGFFFPSAGVLSPYRATVAIMENAVSNGVELALECAVEGFDTADGRVERVRTNRGNFRAAVVVNAAGAWADLVAGYANDRFFSLHPRRGTDLVLDVKAGRFIRHVTAMPSLDQLKSTTKGGGLIVTNEGNVIVGPTARELPGREDYSTEPSELRALERHFRANKALNLSQVITYFAGTRACAWEEDFIVERSEAVRNLVHVAGIQSPGLASAPAIGELAARLAVEALADSGRPAPRPRARFDPARKAPPELRRLDLEARAALVARNPDYGRVVCRCEAVSEGEVRDALDSNVPATSLDALKRRTRVGAGRCHGGFCTPRAMELLAEKLGVDPAEVTRKGPGSAVVVGHTKEARPEPGPGPDAAPRVAASAPGAPSAPRAPDAAPRVAALAPDSEGELP